MCLCKLEIVGYVSSGIMYWRKWCERSGLPFGMNRLRLNLKGGLMEDIAVTSMATVMSLDCHGF
jgi:hypothetical protein